MSFFNLFFLYNSVVLLTKTGIMTSVPNTKWQVQCELETMPCILTVLRSWHEKLKENKIIHLHEQHVDAQLLQSYPTLHEYGLQRLLCPLDSPGKDTAVGCHFFLQEISKTQVFNLHLLHLLPWQVGFFPANSIWEACRKSLQNTKYHFILSYSFSCLQVYGL